MMRLVVVALIGLVFTQVSTEKNMFMDEIGNCKDIKNAPMNWSHITFQRDPTTNEYTFNIDLTIHKEISTNFGMEFNLWKCDSEGNANSCEYFVKEMRSYEICSYLEDDEQFWSVFVMRFEPRLKCPLKPGIYKARQIPFQSEAFKYFPMEHPLIKARLLGLDHDEVVSCVEVEISFGTVKRG